MPEVLPEICEKHSLFFTKKYFSIQITFPPEMLSHAHSMSSKFLCTFLENGNNRNEAWLQMHTIESND